MTSRRRSRRCVAGGVKQEAERASAISLAFFFQLLSSSRALSPLDVEKPFLFSPLLLSLSPLLLLDKQKKTSDPDLGQEGAGQDAVLDDPPLGANAREEVEEKKKGEARFFFVLLFFLSAFCFPTTTLDLDPHLYSCFFSLLQKTKIDISFQIREKRALALFALAGGKRGWMSKEGEQHLSKNKKNKSGSVWRKKQKNFSLDFRAFSRLLPPPRSNQKKTTTNFAVTRLVNCTLQQTIPPFSSLSLSSREPERHHLCRICT